MKNKEQLTGTFSTGATPTEGDFTELIVSNVGVLQSTNDLPKASAANAGHRYLIGDTLYGCEGSGKTWRWSSIVLATSGGNANYLNLTAKPRVNGVELLKDTSTKSLGIRIAECADYKDIIISLRTQIESLQKEIDNLKKTDK